MTSLRILRRLILSLALFVVLAAQPAFAHAILVESTPAANGTVAGPDVKIAIRYNSRIDKHRSRLTLIKADKTTSVLPIADDGAEDLLASSADLPPGDYRIRWQVLAIDGHITRGDVPFTVRAPLPPAN